MSPLLTTFAGDALNAYGFSRGAAGGDTYELIQTQVLTSTATTVSFTGIPQTYAHLQLRIAGKFSAASLTGYAALRFNGFTGDYAYHYLYGAGGGGTAVYHTGSSNTSFASLIFMNANDAGANAVSAYVTDILDYRNTNKYKTVRSNGGRANSSGGMQVNQVSGHWRSTTAITQIDLPVLDGTSFSIGSRFSLYGIRGE